MPPTCWLRSTPRTTKTLKSRYVNHLIPPTHGKMAAVLTAAKESAHVFPLAALPLFAKKPHQGFQLQSSTVRPGITLAISNTASGLHDRLYDFRSGPLSSAYFRDSETGNDYADQRYQSPGWGRFLTPDRGGHPSLGDPGTLNKYAYVGGDPINRIDRHGTDEEDEDCANVAYDCSVIFTADGNGSPLNDPMLLLTAEEDPDSSCFGEGSSISQGCFDDLTVEGEDQNPYANLSQVSQQVLSWLPSAWTWMQSFASLAVPFPNTCETDLAHAGFTAQMVQNFYTNPTAFILDASALPNLTEYNKMENKGADFEEGVAPTSGAHGLYYDANQFWQQSFSMLLATLVHEALHSNGQDDVALAQELDISDEVSKYGSNMITRKLGFDCFGVLQ